MAKKKITRKQLLKQEDEFLTISSRVAMFVSAHLRGLRYIGVAVGVAIIAYLAVNTYLGHVNKKGQDAYNNAYDSLVENMRPDADPENVRKSGDLFVKVIDEYGLSKAARLALPQVAYVECLDKKYDEAIAYYKRFLNKVSEDSQYKFLANLALAACYESKGSFKEAIETLRAVVEAQDNPFKEAAMLSLERVYRLDNQSENAEKVLKEFVETYKTSPFLPMAKARL